MYSLLPNGFVLHIPSGYQIPPNPDNTMYQEYQAWLADDGDPGPAPVVNLYPQREAEEKLLALKQAAETDPVAAMLLRSLTGEG